MKRTKFALFIVVSFLVRLIPHRTLLLAVYDEYLHRDLTLRIANSGIGVLSRDLGSLLGLKAYSYPPLFHVIGALFYGIFKSDFVFFVLPAVYGVLSLIAFYYLSKEILGEENKAFLATLLVGFAPNFLYRTSLYIPENLGVFLFISGLWLIVRFLKTGKTKYLIYSMVLLPVYMVTHRGWVFFVGVGLLMFFVHFIPWVKRHLHYLAVLALAALALYYAPVTGEFIRGLISRMPREEVTALGYLKWIGVVQLIFGVLATKKYLEGDPVRQGLALWAWAFMILGSIAFRFRDPYASLPLSIMAAEYLVDEVFPKLRLILEKITADMSGIGANVFRKALLNKKAVSILIALFIVTPIVQGAYSSYAYITPPTVKDKEAFEWIKENTPEDAVFLVWWDLGYLLIGNTHRKDVVMWKKVYQGFFEEAPDSQEAIKAYSDHVVMFSSTQKERVYHLMELYNVSYIYVDNYRRAYGLIKYGLMEYAPYDTHFKTLFVNGNSELYQFIPNPSLLPPDRDRIEYSGSYEVLVNFLENFWTGYNYADFDDGYKGDYFLNSRIAEIYSYLYQKTGNEKFKERYEWLLRWLAYKQLDNGGFPEGIPPNDFTLYTAFTLEPLMKMPFEGSAKGRKYLQERIKENYIMTTPKDKKGDLFAEAQMLPILYEYSLLNGTVLNNLITKILEEQRKDGSWRESLGGTIVTAFGLARYYQISGDERVLPAIKKAAEWIKEQQEENGHFKGEKGYGYSRATYANVLFVYHIVGMTKEEEQMLNIIKNTYDLNKEPRPLQATLDIFRALKYAYGMENAIEILSEILALQNF
ncbi:Integral membrane protein 1 [Thermococcus sp. 2319x1]|uniref:glycosyltransferase family 39 protein n=1 Tax=Thermococcus sp. 2319x1 TaxID=1674923 RepID=UPI00073A8FEF|nr:glycosyltransferase family 39 protein [Thermococcus sp. 2319x1]ALV61904.1 Integral membrane protein 1 [Thermococcus sp. 2319x1]